MIDSMISSRVKKIKPSGIRRFFDIVTQMEDVISLGVGEPDFATPWHVREEAIYALEKGRTTYTSNSGLLELRQEISHYLSNRYNINYNPEDQVLVTVGASEAIDLAIRALIEPGDEVLIPEPSYVSYSPCVILAGGIPIAVPTTEKTDFRLAGVDLASCITDRSKILILPYPNNPTGAIMECHNLEEIAEILRKNDMLTISDEIYSELTYDLEHISIASLEGMYEKTLVINGFSKSFAMTGWRLGYAAGPPPLIDAMTKIHQYAIMCCPTISQYGAIEALRNGIDSVRRMQEEYDHCRKLMVHGFREMGLDCFEPKGAFYVFPCVKSLGMSSEEFCNRLLDDERVAVVPGNAFGDSGEGYIRCSYAYSMANLEEALTRISRFVTGIRAS